MSDMLTPEEIEAMLSANTAQAGQEDVADGRLDVNEVLNHDEIDALGEIGNICMGTSATTMYTLLGRRVSITTPRVTVFPNLATMLKTYDRPYVVVQVVYTEGLIGGNILLLHEQDALVITDLLLGGEGTYTEGAKLEELHLSAISEVMNQMVGSSATAMANILQTMVNISTPNVMLAHAGDDSEVNTFFGDDDVIIRISFDLEIEGVLQSEIMQIMQANFAKDLVAKLLKEAAETQASTPKPAEQPQPQQQTPPPQQAQPSPPPGYGYPPPPGYGYPPPPGYGYPPQGQQPVDVKPVQYQSFDDSSPYMGPGGNINILIDVPLQVTVELGKTRRTIKEVMEFGKGSIIVLEKLAGEMVEVLVNGKMIARGEVVVIDDNYGVRITEILNPATRLTGLV